MIHFFVFVWKWKVAVRLEITQLSSWSIFVWRDFEKAVRDFLEGPCQNVKFLERGGEIISTFIHSLVNEAVNLFQACEKMFCSPLYEFHDFKGRPHLIWQNGRTMLDLLMRTDMKICFFQINHSLISLSLKSPAQFLWKCFSLKVKGGRSWLGVGAKRESGRGILVREGTSYTWLY